MRRSPAFVSRLGLAAVFVAAVYTASAAPIPAPPNLAAPAPNISFEGGDGASCDAPVVIKGAKHEPEGIRAERWWAFTKNPGGAIESQSLTSKNGKDLETFTMVFADGRRKSVCFDITSFYGKP